MNGVSIANTARARALVVSEDGRVLLIRHVVERDGRPFAFWATPGGRIEPGETARDAVVRELREELQLDLLVDGPVYEAHSEFSDEGVRVANTDIFFIARCDQSSIYLRGVTVEEARALAEVRWWTIGQIEKSDERVFPPDLAPLLRALIGQAHDR
jgi:ADP-ribose pyrophosphatase YjhB (NUDIX family)